MKTGAKVLLKVAASLLATAGAFCIGAYAGMWYCNRWIMPGLEKQYPHDGQLGSEMVVYAVNSGLFAALLTLIAGIIWIIKTSKRSQG